LLLGKLRACGVVGDDLSSIFREHIAAQYSLQLVLHTFDCSLHCIVKSHILHYVEVTWVPALMVFWEKVIILLLFIIIRLDDETGIYHAFHNKEKS